MKKILVPFAIVMLLLTGCGEDRGSSANQPTSKPAPTSSQDPAPLMPEVVGLKAAKAVALLRNAGIKADYVGPDGKKIPMAYEADTTVKESSVPADTPVKGTQRVTITFAASEAESLAQAEAAKMAELEAEGAQKGVPGSQTLFIHSIAEFRKLLRSAGVACDYGLPASEAKAPDEAANCTTEIVISRWDLDTDWSKLRFETQKESYSEEGSAPSLFGQNWIFHGDMEAIVKVQELLGGTIVDP